MAPSSDDHHLVHHQSTPSILYSELEAIQNSTDSYPSSINTPSGRIDVSSDHKISHPDFRTTLDPSRNPKEHPSRLPENNSTDLPRDPHLPHSSSPQHFQAHQTTTPACIPTQNSTNNVSPLNSNTTDTSHAIQSGRPLLPQANYQLETLPPAAQPPQLAPNPNPPLKKNGKPLAQCPYCGMTFKKLEHCQRHERTHTLARPYPCAVCSKTFARQDTLNRHLRLHSRSEGRVAANKSLSQGQESQAPASSPGSLKSPPRKPPSPSITSSIDLLTLSPFLPSPHASPSSLPRHTARERGLSLSALEHSSFPGHLARNVPIVGSGPRQSISLPLQRPQQHHLPPPFQSDGNRSHHFPLTSHIASQPPRTSALCVDARAGIPTEVRRGSWCPGVQNPNEFGIFSSSESTPPHLIRNHSPHHLQRNFEMGNWEANLTSTFGLVEAGIGPVPLSAPATCTNWSALGIELGGTGNSYATSSSSALPTWESLSQFEIQPSNNKLNWPALGPLEEEDRIKPEPGQTHQNTCQVILSSPSQPDSFDQPNTVDPNCLTESSASMMGSTGSENNPSFWCFPTGSSNPPCQSSSQGQASHTVNVNQKDMSDSFGNHWNTPQKQPMEIFNPVIWHPPACHNSEDLETKVLNENSFSGSNNPLSISNSWENNAWEEIIELGF